MMDCPHCGVVIADDVSGRDSRDIRGHLSGALLARVEYVDCPACHVTIERRLPINFRELLGAQWTADGWR
jgi:hypothetical protein